RTLLQPELSGYFNNGLTLCNGTYRAPRYSANQLRSKTNVDNQYRVGLLLFFATIFVIFVVVFVLGITGGFTGFFSGQEVLRCEVFQKLAEFVDALFGDLRLRSEERRVGKGWV